MMVVKVIAVLNVVVVVVFAGTIILVALVRLSSFIESKVLKFV